MTTEQQKQRAVEFLKLLEHPDSKKMASMVTDGFTHTLMTQMPGIPSTTRAQLDQMATALGQMFPKGLNLKFHTVISEGPHVAVQAESDTVAGNGKRYANRYHFYLRFEGDRIAESREYCDTNHVREVFLS